MGLSLVGPSPCLLWGQEQLWTVCFASQPVMWWTKYCTRRTWGGTSASHLASLNPVSYICKVGVNSIWGYYEGCMR